MNNNNTQDLAAYNKSYDASLLKTYLLNIILSKGSYSTTFDFITYIHNKIYQFTTEEKIRANLKLYITNIETVIDELREQDIVNLNDLQYLSEIYKHTENKATISPTQRYITRKLNINLHYIIVAHQLAAQTDTPLAQKGGIQTKKTVKWREEVESEKLFYKNQITRVAHSDRDFFLTNDISVFVPKDSPYLSALSSIEAINYQFSEQLLPLHQNVIISIRQLFFFYYSEETEQLRKVLKSVPKENELISLLSNHTTEWKTISDALKSFIVFVRETIDPMVKITPTEPPSLKKSNRWSLSSFIRKKRTRA